jgi:hypothetical protein
VRCPVHLLRIAMTPKGWTWVAPGCVCVSRLAVERFTPPPHEERLMHRTARTVRASDSAEPDRPSWLLIAGRRTIRHNSPHDSAIIGLLPSKRAD